MSGGGSCGLYCFCCGIFRKQTEYVTDGEIQNTNSEGDTVGTEITDVEQGHEGNTGHISPPFPSRERNGTPTSDNNFQYSEGILNVGLTLEENPGGRNSPLKVPTDSCQTVISCKLTIQVKMKTFLRKCNHLWSKIFWRQELIEIL